METSVSGLVGSSEVHDSASRVPELTNGTTSHSQWLVRIEAPVAYSIQIQPIRTQGAVDASLLQIDAISC